MTAPSTAGADLRFGYSIACGPRFMTRGWVIVEGGEVRMEIRRIYRWAVPALVIHGVAPFTIRHASVRTPPLRWGLLMPGREAFATALLDSRRHEQLIRPFGACGIAYTVEETGRDIGIGAGHAGGIGKQWPPPWGQPLRQALRRVRER